MFCLQVWQWLTDEVRPVRLPPFDILIFGIGEPQSLWVVLQFQRDSVQLDLCHDLAVLEFGGGVLENSRAMIKISLLQVQRSRISDGEAVGRNYQLCYLRETLGRWLDVLQLCQTESIPNPQFHQHLIRYNVL